jgi:DNA-binding transcriptional MerR regulator
MKTVKEISKLTGISVRALHYYDEIGLLKPTAKSEAGYRLYDEKALETLQQILFFREFDMPLKEIRDVMDSPVWDRNRILQTQKKMLTAKKERIERLIASIDDILKGENKMDFEVFNRSELEELCQSTIDHMPDFMRECITREFGGIEQWRSHYIERASQEDMQKGYQKLIDWYGDKESALHAMIHPPAPETAAACEKQADALMKELAARKSEPVDSPPVRELVAEYGALLQQLSSVKKVEGYLLVLADDYRNERVKAENDRRYGEGSAEFFARAIEAFCRQGGGLTPQDSRES